MARPLLALFGPAEHVVHLFYLIKVIIVLGVIAVVAVDMVANLVEDSIKTLTLPLLERSTFGTDGGRGLSGRRWRWRPTQVRR